MQYGSLGETFYFAFAVNAADGGGYYPAFQSVNIYVHKFGDPYDQDPRYTVTLTEGDSRLISATWPNGCWVCPIPATTANDFEAGGHYAVFARTTVGAVQPTAMIGQFKLTTDGSIPGSVTVSPANQTTGYATVYDEDGVAEAGVVVTCQLISVDNSITGRIFDSAVRSETSNGAGLVQFTGLFIGATYEFKRRTSSAVAATGYKITIPTTYTASTFPLPPIIGTP